MHIFYLNPNEWKEPSALEYTLEGSEAKHLAQILRLNQGEEITLINGQGRTGNFKIEKIAKSYVNLLKIKEQYTAKPAHATILALASTKALKRSWIMEKAVEFHAGEIWLWQAERSQGKISPDVVEHYQNQLIAGAKQCRNPWLPTLKVIGSKLDNGEKNGAKALASAFDLKIHAPCLLWEGENTNKTLSDQDLHASEKSVIYIIGPEGGITDQEVKVLLEGGAISKSLGPSILRYESAALLCLGLSWWANSQRAGSL